MYLSPDYTHFLGRHGGRPYEAKRFEGGRRAGHPFDFPQGREALERRARL